MKRVVPTSTAIVDWFFDWCVAHAHDKQCDLHLLLQSRVLFKWYVHMLRTQEPSVRRLLMQAETTWEQEFIWLKHRERMISRYPKSILKDIRKSNTN